MARSTRSSCRTWRSSLVYESVDGRRPRACRLKGVSGGTLAARRERRQGARRLRQLARRIIRLATIDGTNVSTSTVVAARAPCSTRCSCSAAATSRTWSGRATRRPRAAVPCPDPAPRRRDLLRRPWSTASGSPSGSRRPSGRCRSCSIRTRASSTCSSSGNPNKEGGGRLTHYERAPGGGWTATPLQSGPAEGGADHPARRLRRHARGPVQGPVRGQRPDDDEALGPQSPATSLPSARRKARLDTPRHGGPTVRRSRASSRSRSTR